MKRRILLISIILTIVLPNVLFKIIERKYTFRPEQIISNDAMMTECTIDVYHEGSERKMELEEYVLCVLLGEVPASFEPEALKAQAIATRTYTLHKAVRQAKHADYHVCSDASCCQAFVSAADYLLNNGTHDDLNKIKAAVKDTAGMVLLYDDQLIEATYFSCSGGRTEDAAAVWGADVPYLQSVESPGEEASEKYIKTLYFSKKEFLSMLGITELEDCSMSDMNISYTHGGGIEYLELAERSFSGTQLRSLLKLPSTAAVFTVNKDSVVVTVKGYGHRVGMSQYGADAMAVAGESFENILRHYYPGTSIAILSEKHIESMFDKDENL